MKVHKNVVALGWEKKNIRHTWRTLLSNGVCLLRIFAGHLLKCIGTSDLKMEW